MIYRLLILLALALVGIAVWLTLAPQQQEPVTAHSSGPVGPDQSYSATNAVMVETGTDGMPMYTLQARQVQQDADPNLVNLSTVVATFRDSHGGQWLAHADHAVAQQDSAQIELTGAINLTGTFAGNPKPATIITERLHVDTRKQIIRIRAPVKLTWAGIVVNAQGLVVNTMDQSVRLDSEVHDHALP